MTKTLRFGFDSASPRIASRIDRFVVRRHTRAGYDRCMELAAQDYARHVALQVSPGHKRSDCPHNQTHCIRAGLSAASCPICSGSARQR